MYYARILEQPTCRWSTLECLGAEGEDAPPFCDTPEVTQRVQQRAWTSPIWLMPHERVSQDP